MGYGSTPVAVRQQTQGRRAAAATALLLCACCAAFLSSNNIGGSLSVANHKQSDMATSRKQHIRAKKALHKWSDELTGFAEGKDNLGQLKNKMSSGSMDLPGAEKTDQNTCLNKKYAELLAAHKNEQVRNEGVIGDDFKEEKTGKDDYANARNKVALKDKSYKPVAAADAEAKVLAGFINALEIVEASKWIEAQTCEETQSCDEKTTKLINLLGPSAGSVDSAKTFVEQIKEDFPSLVHQCFILDCEPGKGLEHTSGGPKCNNCETGKSWNGETDAEPCADVKPGCEPGEGYSESTGRDVDATCIACESGKFSSSDSDEECGDHEVTTCEAGQELTAGTTDSDGVCSDCARGTFNPGSFNPDGTSFLLHGPHSRCLAHSTVSCPAGTESKEGNAFEDTFCDDCEGGTFSLGGGAACGPHGSTNCGPGFFHVPGTRSSTHSCRACPAGQFKAGENGGTHCSAITIATCPIGKQLTAGTGSSNGHCSNCPAGQVKETSGPGPCRAFEFTARAVSGHCHRYRSYKRYGSCAGNHARVDCATNYAAVDSRNTCFTMAKDTGAVAMAWHPEIGDCVAYFQPGGCRFTGVDWGYQYYTMH